MIEEGKTEMGPILQTRTRQNMSEGKLTVPEEDKTELAKHCKPELGKTLHS